MNTLKTSLLLVMLSGLPVLAVAAPIVEVVPNGQGGVAVHVQNVLSMPTDFSVPYACKKNQANHYSLSGHLEVFRVNQYNAGFVQSMRNSLNSGVYVQCSVSGSGSCITPQPSPSGDGNGTATCSGTVLGALTILTVRCSCT